MKTTSRILAFLLIALSVATCKKDSVFDENGYYGEGMATINGYSWIGNNVGIIYDQSPNDVKTNHCLNIHLLHRSKDGLLLSAVEFFDVNPVIGRRTLSYIVPSWERAPDRIQVTEWDDDAALGGYYVFEQSDSNYLDITDLNWETGDVKGHFQATLIRDSSWVAPGQTADTLRIRNGSFYGKIYWEN